MPECRVSIIIPARNARGHLEECLGALQSEPLEEAEVIVVDDASTDDTGEFALSRGIRLYRLEARSGPSRARNFGAEHARGEYFFFVDADVAVRPGAVRRVQELLDENQAIAAVFGSYDSDPREQGALTQYRNLLHHYVHQEGRREASTFWAGCGAIRRPVFMEMKGFDEIEYPLCIEDIELGYRLRQAGHNVVLDRGLLGKHLKRWTLFSMIRADVFCRAIPWAHLNLTRKVSLDDLNIKKSQKFSVLLTASGFLFLLLSLISTWFLAASALAVLATVVLNGRLFLFFRAERGFLFALGCIPLHLLYFLYSGLSFLYVWLALRLNIPVRDGNRTFRSGHIV